MVDCFARLNDNAISLLDAKIIVLTIYCFNHKQIADFLKYELSSIQTYTSRLHGKVGVHCALELVRLSLSQGFDLDGLYKGEVIIEATLIKAYAKEKGIVI